MKHSVLRSLHIGLCIRALSYSSMKFFAQLITEDVEVLSCEDVVPLLVVVAAATLDTDSGIVSLLAPATVKLPANVLTIFVCTDLVCTQSSSVISGDESELKGH